MVILKVLILNYQYRNKELPRLFFILSVSLYTYIHQKRNIYEYYQYFLLLFTGPLDPDYDDARVFKRTAAVGIKRALKAGSKRPLLVLEENNFKNGQLVALLGALEALYTVCIIYYILFCL